ncbi:roundabout homolog 3-like isoform X2 [Poecilia formosa]|uniref:roundabout homolog 3-like isoform X2 n=1 Tax=Poecilia formosa TaxID=48698 RepID=UPI0007B904F8|nr:PREDICTED: roundabout homolog 3-like isoform X2 [Poecilia formosa]
MAEQIASVIRQPAFIAGLGVAAWLVLMGSGGLLYCRHRRRKQLGHYTTSFAYTPAVGFAHSEGSGIINGGPGLLGSNMGNYPWLADSWPTPNLTHSKDFVNCCSGKLDSERYYNSVGIINYPSQTEKRSTASNDSPIYSTINTAAEDDLLAYYDTYSSVPFNQGPNPYSSNPVLSSAGILGLEQDLDRWTIQSGQSGSEYAKLQYTKKSNDKLASQASAGSLSTPAPLTWVDVLSLPLPPNKGRDHPKPDKEEAQHSSEEEDDDWCPPLPARTYLMDSYREEGSGLPYRPEEVTPPPQHDAPQPGDSPRVQHFDLLVRHQQSQVSQSNPDLFTNTKVLEGSDLHNHSSQWADNFRGESVGKGQSLAAAAESSPTAAAQKPRSKKRAPRDGQSRRERHGDAAELPPPPAPPAADGSLQLFVDVSSRRQTDSETREGSDLPALLKRGDDSSPQRGGLAKWLSQDENVIPYGQPNVLSKVQTLGYGSLGGRAFPRPAAAAQRRDENLI